jgi:hypothetical protein
VTVWISLVCRKPEIMCNFAQIVQNACSIPQTESITALTVWGLDLLKV